MLNDCHRLWEWADKVSSVIRLHFYGEVGPEAARNISATAERALAGAGKLLSFSLL